MMSSECPEDAVTTAETDRDALLGAIGFKPGPLGEGLRRKVILDDAGGLRQAMVEARLEAADREMDADLWWLSCEEGQRSPLLVRVWRQRREAQRDFRNLLGHMERLILSAEQLAGDSKDPGTEALAAIWSAREALYRAGLRPISVAPLLDERMWWFLAILSAAGGHAAASSNPGEWVSAFCDDREPVDTYNLCEDLGYTFTSHDNRFDSSIERLTDHGRVALELDSRSLKVPA